MSSTSATSSDPIVISLPEEITNLDHEVTPAMEPVVSLLQNLAEVAPSAIRIGIGAESVGLETFTNYYNMIDSLEVRLIRAAQLLVVEQGALSPERCASWAETRAGLVAIMYGLYESPFTEKARENVIDIAARLYETLSVLPSKGERDGATSVRQAEVSFTPAGQQAPSHFKELSDVLSALNLDSSPQLLESQKPEGNKLVTATPPSTESSDSVHGKRRSASLAAQSPTDKFTERPRSTEAGSSTDDHATLGRGDKTNYFMTFHNKAVEEKLGVSFATYPIGRTRDDWIASISVNGIKYEGGPVKSKLEAREIAAEKALRGLGWL